MRRSASWKSVTGAVLGVLITSSCTQTLDFDELSSRHERKADAGRKPDSGLSRDAARDLDASRERDTGGDADAGPTGLVDASAIDAAAAPSDDVDSGVPSWCPKQSDVVVCDDFETPEPKTFEQWIVNEWSTNAASVDIVADTTRALSPKTSMLTLVHAGATKDEAVASSLRKELSGFDGVPFHMDVDFYMQVEKFDPRADVELTPFQVLFGSKLTGWYGQLALILVTRGEKLAVFFGERAVEVDTDGTEDPQPDRRTPEHPLPKPGDWTHVRFIVDASNQSAMGRAELSVGDDTLFSGKLSYPMEKLTPAIELGAPWVATTPHETAEWRIRYDDVVIKVHAQ